MKPGYQSTSHELARISLGRLTPQTPLNRDNTGASGAVQYVRLLDMKLVVRQWRVLNLIRQFQQLKTSQIHALEFYDVSRYPCDRTLKRLQSLGLIEPVRERLPGGDRGGSPENVWQLARGGYSLFPNEKRRRNSTIHYHMLVVADVYIAALKASRDGWCEIKEWAVEADAWVSVNGADIRPDLYMRIVHLVKRQEHRYNIEVDLGGERQKQIVEKLNRYIYATQYAADYPDGKQRRLLFLTDTPERKIELTRIVNRTGAPEGLVVVELVNNWPEFIK